MRSIVSRRRVLAGGSLGALASLAGCLATGRGETETVTEPVETEGISELSLSTANGSVTVEGAADGEETLEVRGHKAAPTEGALESLTLETTRSDERLAIEANSEDVPFLFGPDPKLALEVTIPDELGVIRGEATNGDIEVEGFDGVTPEDGDDVTVTVGDGSRRIRAETTNGSVTVRREAED